MKNRNFDDFDKYADDYRKIHTQNVKWSGADSFYFAELKVKLLQDSEKNEPLQILDVGCGDGITEKYIGEYFPLWKIIGIDVSRESIIVAQKQNLTNAFFKHYDGISIPYPENFFQIIFIAGVLHHVDFGLHQKLISEMYRVLKPGGRIYLFEHNPYNPVTRHLVNTCIFDEDARLLKPGYTLKLFREYNFTICRRQFIIFFPRRGFLSKLIFLEKYLKAIPLGGQYFFSFKKD